MRKPINILDFLEVVDDICRIRPRGECYAGALTSHAAQPDGAHALIRFLASPEAGPAIWKAGLAPLSAR